MMYVCKEGGEGNRINVLGTVNSENGIKCDSRSIYYFTYIHSVPAYDLRTYLARYIEVLYAAAQASWFLAIVH